MSRMATHTRIAFGAATTAPPEGTDMVEMSRALAQEKVVLTQTLTNNSLMRKLCCKCRREPLTYSKWF